MRPSLLAVHTADTTREGNGMARRVLFAIPQPLPSRNPHPVVQLRDASAWAAAGHHVTVAAPWSQDEAAVRDWYGLDDRVDLRAVGDAEATERRLLPALAAEVWSGRHDTLVTSLVGLAAIARPGLTVVVERHGLPKSPVRRRLTQAALARPRSLLLINSPPTLVQHLDAGVGRPDRSLVGWLPAARPVDGIERWTGDDRMRVSVIAHSSTRHPDTAAVAPMLADDRFAWDVLGSSGTDELARELGPEVIERVTFHGFVPPARLIGVLAGSQVSLAHYPRARPDGQRTPTKVLDAASAGCAVVATDTDNTRAMLAGAGELFPSGSTDAALGLLHALADDPDRLHEQRLGSLRAARLADAGARVGRIARALDELDADGRVSEEARS